MVVDEAFVELKTDAGKTYFWNRRENTRTWALPEGVSVKWVGQKAPDGRTYYWCRETKETIWLLPPIPKEEDAANEADAAVAAAEGSPSVPAASSTATAGGAPAAPEKPLKGLALLRAVKEPPGPRGDSASAVAARHVIEKSGCDTWFYRNSNDEWEEALLFWPPPQQTPLGSKPRARQSKQDPHSLRDLIHRCQQHEDMARALFYAHHGAIMKFSPKQFPLPQQNEWAFWTCEGKQLLVDAEAPLPSEEDINSGKPLSTPVLRRNPPEGGKWKMLAARTRSGLSMIYNARKLRSLEFAIKNNDTVVVQRLMDELSSKVPEGLKFRAKLCLLPAPPAKQPPPQRPDANANTVPSSPPPPAAVMPGALMTAPTAFSSPPPMPTMPPMPPLPGSDPLLGFPKQPPPPNGDSNLDSSAAGAASTATLLPRGPPPPAPEVAAPLASVLEPQADAGSTGPSSQPSMLMKAPPPMPPAPPPAPMREPAWKAPGPGPDGGLPTKAPPMKAPPLAPTLGAGQVDTDAAATAQEAQPVPPAASSAPVSSSTAEAKPAFDVEAAAKEWQRASKASIEPDEDAPWKKRRRAKAAVGPPGKKGQADVRSAAKLVASAERIAAATDPKKQAQALAAEEKLRKKVVVSNVPAAASNVDLADFFTGAIFSATGHTLAAEWQSGAAKVVVGVERSSASKNASVHFGTALGASVALMLNGIQFQGQALSLKRPTGYTGPNIAPKLKGISIKELVATSGKSSESRPKPSSDTSDRKVRLTGIPASMDSSSVFDLLQQFGGPLKGLNLALDGATGKHQGTGTAEFVEKASALEAIRFSPLLGFIDVASEKKSSAPSGEASARKRPRRSRFDPTPGETAKKAVAEEDDELGPFKAALASRAQKAGEKDEELDLGPFESVLVKAPAKQPDATVLEAPFDDADDLGPFESVLPAASSKAKPSKDDDTVDGSDTEADDDEEFDPFSAVLPPEKNEAPPQQAPASAEDGSDTEADDDEDDLGPFNAVLPPK